MRVYELVFGDGSLEELIDRIASEATELVPGLPRLAVRRLVDLMLRSRTRQTTSCGQFHACNPRESLWGHHQPPQGSTRPCALYEGDPYALPQIFGASASDLLGPDVPLTERKAAEEQLAGVLRRALEPILFRNPNCGRVAVCCAPLTNPFEEAHMSVLATDLAVLKDEVRLKLHLAGMDVRDAWHRLEPTIYKVEEELASVGEQASEELVASVRATRDALRRLLDRIEDRV